MQQEQFQAKANNKRKEDNYIIIRAIAATPLQHTHKHSLQSQGICACSANEGERKRKWRIVKILFSLEKQQQITNAFDLWFAARSLIASGGWKRWRERERESGGQMDMTAKKDSVSQSDSAQISLGCTVLLRGESNREIITTITTTINNNKSLSTSWVIDCAKRQGRKGNERGLGRQVDADKTLNTTWQAISGRPLLSIEVLYRFPRVEQKAKCTKWWW